MSFASAYWGHKPDIPAELKNEDPEMVKLANDVRRKLAVQPPNKRVVGVSEEWGQADGQAGGRIGGQVERGLQVTVKVLF